MLPLRLKSLTSVFRGWRLVVTLSTGLLSGCDTLSYFGQAASGQWRILHAREPIDALIAAPTTDPTLRQKLSLVMEARHWAHQELRLNVGDAYTEYVGLDRPYVVWNVVSAPEFSVTPMQWCFPVAGCVSYRGYFDEADATKYAETLKQKGYDTYIGGVDAYSTLGWFDDPVLSTFVRRSDTSLVALVFHELAHRTLYVKNDSTFNESFATIVEEEGVRRWLEARQGNAEWEQFLKQKQHRDVFVELVLDYRGQLEQLYSSPLPDPEKRLQKQKLAEQTRERYRHIRDTQWQGYNGYDRWMNGTLNNAQVSTISTYHAYVPGFRQLLKQCGQDLPCFYKRAKALTELKPDLRKDALEALEKGTDPDSAP